MSKWDKEYIKLCKKILNEGKRVQNRTGIDTIKIPGYSFEFDLSEEFPALTTKQLFFRQAILEMLWIYQVQSNDVRWLQERNVHIWDEWEIQEDGKWYANQNVLEDGKMVKKDVVKDLEKKMDKTSAYQLEGDLEIVNNELTEAAKISLNLDESYHKEHTIQKEAKLVAFTFDDGPSKYTLDIANILEEYNASATFFEVGYNIKAHPEITKELSERGFEIANHTTDHSKLTKLTETKYLTKINDNNFFIQLSSEFSYIYKNIFFNKSKD